MSERMLVAPEEPALLYEFDEKAPPRTRPLTQGDVFRDVVTIGGATLPLAMIIAHPCSMRTGPKLRKEQGRDPRRRVGAQGAHRRTQRRVPGILGSPG